MPKRGYSRSSGRGGLRPTPLATVSLPTGAAMRPGEFCSAGLLALGASFVFGRLVATVAWGGSTPALLLGLVIGLTFAAAGTVVLCVVDARHARRTDRIAGESVFVALSAIVFVGSVLGALF